MSLVDFSAPWEYETEEQRRERESRKFMSSASSVMEDYERGQREQESTRFREMVQPSLMEFENQQAEAAQREQESVKFQYAAKSLLDDFLRQDRETESQKFREGAKALMEGGGGAWGDEPQGLFAKRGVSKEDQRIRPGETATEYRDRLNIPQGLNPNTASFSDIISANPTDIPGVESAIQSLPRPLSIPIDIAAKSINPITAATLPVFGPAAIAKGVGGASLGALAGYGAEQAGAPDIPTPLGSVSPETLGTVVGGLYGGASKEDFTRGLPDFAAEEAKLAGRQRLSRGIAGAAGTEKEWTPAVGKRELMGLIKRKAEDWRETAVLRTEERARRVANAEEIERQALDAGLSPFEATARSKSALTGKMPVVKAAGYDVSDKTVAWIGDQVQNSLAYYERVNLSDMFAAMANDPTTEMRPFEKRLLEKALGVEIADTMERVSIIRARASAELADAKRLATLKPGGAEGISTQSTFWSAAPPAMGEGTLGEQAGMNITEPQLISRTVDNRTDLQKKVDTWLLKTAAYRAEHPAENPIGEWVASGGDVEAKNLAFEGTLGEQAGMNITEPQLISRTVDNRTDLQKKVDTWLLKTAAYRAKHPVESPMDEWVASGSDVGAKNLAFAGMEPPLPKNDGSLWSRLAHALYIPQTIRSSFDLSYPLRQGWKASLRYPKEFWGNFKPMVQSAASKDKAEMFDTRMKTDATVITVNGRKTFLGDALQGMDILNPLPGQEAGGVGKTVGMPSTWANNLPGLRRFTRAFVTFGNKLRFDISKYWVQKWEHDGVPITTEKLENLGKFVNRLTGQGYLGNDQISAALKAIDWAPGFRASGPQAIGWLWHSDPQMRRIAIESLVPWVSGGVGMLTLAKMSGTADVQLEPGADFGKMRFGNVRVNIFGTDQLLARTIYQAATGKSVDYLTGPHKSDWKDVVLRYGRSGLSPLAGTAVDIWQGENYVGDKLKWDASSALKVLESNLPMVISDIKDLWRKGSAPWAIAGGVYSIIGGGISAYETPEQKLAKAYNETSPTLYKDTPSAIRSKRIAENPELNKLNLERDTESQKINLTTEQPLIPTANAVNQNLPDAGTSYREQRKTILKERMDKKDQEFKGSQSPTREADKLADGYYAIQPEMGPDGFIGPDDMKAFFKAQEDYLAKVPADLRDAITKPVRFSDPKVQAAEDRYQKALDTYKVYIGTPKYRGLSVEKGDIIDDALNYMNSIRERNPDLSRREALELISNKLSAWSYQYLTDLMDPQWAKELQNPKRDQIAAQNPDLIYFGLVSENSLTMENRGRLPSYVRKDAMRPGARELAGVR